MMASAAICAFGAAVSWWAARRVVAEGRDYIWLSLALSTFGVFVVLSAAFVLAGLIGGAP